MHSAQPLALPLSSRSVEPCTTAALSTAAAAAVDARGDTLARGSTVVAALAVAVAHPETNKIFSASTQSAMAPALARHRVPIAQRMIFHTRRLDNGSRSGSSSISSGQGKQARPPGFDALLGFDSTYVERSLSKPAVRALSGPGAGEVRPVTAADELQRRPMLRFQLSRFLTPAEQTRHAAGLLAREEISAKVCGLLASCCSR